MKSTKISNIPPMSKYIIAENCTNTPVLPISECIDGDQRFTQLSECIDGDQRFTQYCLATGFILDRIVCVYIDEFIEKTDDTPHEFFYNDIKHIMSWKNGIMELRREWTRDPHWHAGYGPIITHNNPHEFVCRK
jgi:hypothetical protein